MSSEPFKTLPLEIRCEIANHLYSWRDWLAFRHIDQPNLRQCVPKRIKQRFAPIRFSSPNFLDSLGDVYNSSETFRALFNVCGIHLANTTVELRWYKEINWLDFVRRRNFYWSLISLLVTIGSRGSHLLRAGSTSGIDAGSIADLIESACRRFTLTSTACDGPIPLRYQRYIRLLSQCSAALDFARPALPPSWSVLYSSAEVVAEGLVKRELLPFVLMLSGLDDTIDEGYVEELEAELQAKFEELDTFRLLGLRQTLLLVGVTTSWEFTRIRSNSSARESL